MLASIPSPSSNALHLGPLQLRAYGLCIAAGVLAGATLASRRWEKKGGSRQTLSSILIWAVPAGIVGARMYHIITDWKSFRGRWIETLYIWQGGLGIWGGVALGVLVGLWQARKRGCRSLPLLDAAAPALALSQAIGRWGNWFNQELFGRPTTHWWGLKIDDAHLPLQYPRGTLFHPTFLYESLWNFALVGVLLFVDKRLKFKQGQMFALYVMGYTFARFFIEHIRIDFASKLGGLRVNEWVSSVVFVLALIAFLWLGRRLQSDEPVERLALPAETESSAESGVS